MSHCELAVIHLVMWAGMFSVDLSETLTVLQTRPSNRPTHFTWGNCFLEANSSDQKQMSHKTVTIDELIPLNQSNLSSHD